MELSITPGTLKDIEIISDLAQRTWPVAYRNVIPHAQIAYMLDLMYSPNALEKQMASEHRFFIARHENIPCGFASSGEGAPTVFRLHKLYVLPEFQGRGIGRTLLHTVEKFAQQAGAEWIELNVNRKNPARNFYLRENFEDFKMEVIDIGNGFIMDDFVMRKRLG